AIPASFKRMSLRVCIQLLNLPNTFPRSDVAKNNSSPNTSFPIKSVKIFFPERGGERNTKTVP
ncbi:7171_t:CDS:1, partial [Funneliformis geosporum]